MYCKLYRDLVSASYTITEINSLRTQLIISVSVLKRVGEQSESTSVYVMEKSENLLF